MAAITSIGVGDIVKGKGPIPFDIYGKEWEVVKIETVRIGTPCWLKRVGDGVWYEYPVPVELLVLVRKGRNVASSR